ncbi:PEP-CTERM sorting domain-containing protein [Pseudoduganella sp. HUAS MS19]
MKRLNRMIATIAAAAALCSPLAQATTWTLFFNNAGLYTNNGTNPPLMPGMTDTDTWATLTFTDHNTSVVDITLHVLSGVMQPGPYVNDWWFNGNALAQSATFLNVGGVDANLTICPNCSNGAASGKYDGVFHFANANPGELGQGNTSSWTATIDSGILSVSDFQFLSAPQGGQDEYYAAIHVQGSGVSEKGGACVPGETDCEPPPECPPGDTSPECGGGEQEVPEPATLVILGTGMLGMALARRRRVR